MSRCSRICNGQSTKEPQRSTSLGEETVNYSIETTYFHSISTDFHKPCDLFWDRWSHLYNSHKLNGLQEGHRGSLPAFGIPPATPLEGHPSSRLGLSWDRPQQSRVDQALGSVRGHSTGSSSCSASIWITRVLQLPLVEVSGGRSEGGVYKIAPPNILKWDMIIPEPRRRHRINFSLSRP